MDNAKNDPLRENQMEILNDAAAAAPAPDSVTVNIGENQMEISNITPNIPVGTVGSGTLDGKQYVVLTNDQYKQCIDKTEGGRKSKNNDDMAAENHPNALKRAVVVDAVDKLFIFY